MLLYNNNTEKLHLHRLFSSLSRSFSPSHAISRFDFIQHWNVILWPHFCCWEFFVKLQWLARTLSHEKRRIFEGISYDRAFFFPVLLLHAFSHRWIYIYREVQITTKRFLHTLYPHVYVHIYIRYSTTFHIITGDGVYAKLRCIIYPCTIATYYR